MKYNRVPVAEADRDEHQHQQHRDDERPLQVGLDARGVVEAAGRRAVIADAHLRVGGGEAFYLFVQPLEEGGALARVGGGIHRRDEGHAHGGIRHEEVAFQGLVATRRALRQGFQLVGQDIAQAQRVHLQQFGEGLPHGLAEVLAVGRHLANKVLTRQQGVEGGVGRSINISRELDGQIVYDIGHQVVRQAVEHVAYDPCGRVAGGVPGQERVHKSVTGRNNLRNGGAVLSLEQQEGLVLDAQVGKGQLGAAVLVLRRGHQLVDVLLQMNLQREPAQHAEQQQHRRPAHGTVAAEEAVNTNAKCGHTPISPFSSI